MEQYVHNVEPKRRHSVQGVIPTEGQDGKGTITLGTVYLRIRRRDSGEKRNEKQKLEEKEKEKEEDDEEREEREEREEEEDDDDEEEDYDDEVRL